MSSPGLFEDVTDKAGITFSHTNGSVKRFYYIETVGGGCAFLDFDSDGFQDVLMLSSGEIHSPPEPAPPNLALYRNKGDGSFTDVTRGSGLENPLGYGQGLAVGDYDNDGYPDIYVAAYPGCRLYRNLKVAASGPGPLFEDVTNSAGVAGLESGPRWASGAAWADYDNDGKLDLYVTRYAPWRPETDVKCMRGDGRQGYCFPTHYPGYHHALYHNEGGGRFRDVTRKAGLLGLATRGLAVAWLDFDGDGLLDICTANDLHPTALLRNSGKGTFTNVAVEAGVAYGADGVSTSGMGIALGDYDHSGRESLFISNLHGQVYSLFRNEGGGQFTFASIDAGVREGTIRRTGWGVAFFDFDRDSWLDLVCSNGNVHEELAEELPGIDYAQPKTLFRNRGDGAFEDITDRSGAMTLARVGRGLAVGDYDNDGRPDVLCVNRNQRADLFRNVSSDANRWISLRLVGVRSNRDGAGAKVWITAGGIRQFAECRLGSSYASSSDKRLHFGLGAHDRVSNIEIKWPSGLRDEYRDLESGRFYAISEGKACVVDAKAGPESAP